MNRKTTFMIALATVSTALLGFVAAGNAFGSGWTEYSGRVVAGQAYALSVDDETEALQIQLSPGLLGDAEAQATLFDPDDVRVGHYTLTRTDDSVTISKPKDGDFVLFVYSVSNGVLTVSKKGGADDLELVAIETATENFEVATQDASGAFRAINTVMVDREPLFESLLYQGSAVNLTGTVRTIDGLTFKVDRETGSAAGPGLFTAQIGERAGFPENFAAGLHTIEVAADEFEGTLVLTTVHYVREGAVDVVDPTVEVPVNALVLDGSHEATAFFVPDGVSVISLGLVPSAEEEEEDEEDEEGDRAAGHGPKGYYNEVAIVSIYTPDDQLLGFVELDEENAMASLPIEYSGEYVAFVYTSGENGVFAVLDEGSVAFEDERHLRVHEIPTTLASASSPLAYKESFVQEIAAAPLAIGIGMTGDAAYALDLRAMIHTDAGEIETYDWSLPATNALPWFRMGHAAYAGPELVAGTWAIDVEALSSMGEVTLFELHYDRELEVEADEDEEDDGE
ncbi:MAG TPA: hypothetical protein VI997_01965 [Candidatus Thermoplasmatota archaeon]|nr:hypothetical protein [Candidatus Thermoplasmatota archaeon]